MSAHRVPIQDRFWSKVEKRDGCWEWIARKNTKGYGLISESGRSGYRMAHRVAYAIANGPISEGLVVDHLCHNPGCVNPDHLQATTVKINGENRRGANRNSRSGVRGVRWHERSRRWEVRVTHLGVTHFGGGFLSLEEAAQAAVSLRARLFGDGR